MMEVISRVKEFTQIIRRGFRDLVDAKKKSLP
jgi:hypothetical protein